VKLVNFVTCLLLLFFSPFILLGQGANVIIHLKDSSIVEGELLFIHDDSLKIVNSLSPQNIESNRTFLNVNIQTVSLHLRKPEKASLIAKILSAGLGIALGGLIVNMLFPSEDEQNRFNHVLGVIVGAGLGGQIGWSLASALHYENEVYDPNNPEQRALLRNYARNN
jgi:hypothetical protein